MGELTEATIAKAIAFEMLDDYEEHDFEFSITATTTEGGIIYASGEDENGEWFEFACEVRFT